MMILFLLLQLIPLHQSLIPHKSFLKQSKHKMSLLGIDPYQYYCGNFPNNEETNKSYLQTLSIKEYTKFLQSLSQSDYNQYDPLYKTKAFFSQCENSKSDLGQTLRSFNEEIKSITTKMMSQSSPNICGNVQSQDCKDFSNELSELNGLGSNALFTFRRIKFERHFVALSDTFNMLMPSFTIGQANLPSKKAYKSHSAYDPNSRAFDSKVKESITQLKTLIGEDMSDSEIETLAIIDKKLSSHFPRNVTIMGMLSPNVWDKMSLAQLKGNFGWVNWESYFEEIDESVNQVIVYCPACFLRMQKVMEQYSPSVLAKYFRYAILNGIHKEIDSLEFAENKVSGGRCAVLTAKYFAPVINNKLFRDFKTITQTDINQIMDTAIALVNILRLLNKQPPTLYGKLIAAKSAGRFGVPFANYSENQLKDYYRIYNQTENRNFAHALLQAKVFNFVRSLNSNDNVKQLPSIHNMFIDLRREEMSYHSGVLNEPFMINTKDEEYRQSQFALHVSMAVFREVGLVWTKHMNVHIINSRAHLIGCKHGNKQVVPHPLYLIFHISEEIAAYVSNMHIRKIHPLNRERNKYIVYIKNQMQGFCYKHTSSKYVQDIDQHKIPQRCLFNYVARVTKKDFYVY